MAERRSTEGDVRVDAARREAREPQAVRGARTRAAVLRGIAIGLGCAVTVAAFVPTVWCLLGPVGGGLLGAFYAKAPTATDALIERAEAMQATRDGSHG